MGGEVELAEVLFLDVVEEVAVDCVRRPLPLQLEDDHARVVAGGEEVEGRVRRDDPEAVVLAPEWGKVEIHNVDTIFDLYDTMNPKATHY